MFDNILLPLQHNKNYYYYKGSKKTPKSKTDNQKKSKSDGRRDKEKHASFVTCNGCR